MNPCIKKKNPSNVAFCSSTRCRSDSACAPVVSSADSISRAVSRLSTPATVLTKKRRPSGSP